MTDEFREQITKIEDLWAHVYKECKDNPGVYSGHLRGLTVYDVGQAVLTVLEWLKRLLPRKRTSGAYRIAKGLLLTSLGNTITQLEQLVSGQYEHFPALIVQLNQTLVSLFPLTFLSTDTSEKTAAALSARLAEVIGQLETVSSRLDEEVENCKKAAEWRETAEQAATEAGNSTNTARAALEETEQVLAQSQEKLSEIESNKATIAQNAETVQGFAEDVAELRRSLDDTQTRLDALVTAAEEDQQTIEYLLPQAASAGLASAFAARVEQLRKVMKYWMAGFVVSIVALASSVIISFVVYPPAEQAQFWQSVLKRAPYAAPWIWLAWFCARNYGHTVRLQEVYAFKEAASRAFEGYKKQMLEIGEADADDTNALVTELSMRAMHILSKEPLQVFDRKATDETPFNALAERLPFLRKSDEQDVVEAE